MLEPSLSSTLARRQSFNQSRAIAAGSRWQEFGARDEQIEALKREVVQLGQVSNAELTNKIEQMFEGFCRKVGATIARVDELTRSADRRQPLDLPPLPLARRVN
jgi:hypothetical protein